MRIIFIGNLEKWMMFITFVLLKIKLNISL